MSIKKKVYCYKLSVKQGKTDLSSSEIKSVLEKILTHCNDKKALSIDSEDDKITLDNYKLIDEYFFARLGKEQDIQSLAIRTEERSAKDVLPNRGNQWIDKLTYILIDLKMKILMIVSSKSAPKAYAIDNMFLKYAPSYSIDMDEIPNKEYYQQLYKKGAGISKLRYKIAVPDVGMLQEIPGLSNAQFKALKEASSTELEICISAGRRKLLSSDSDVVTSIVKDTVEHSNNYERVEIVGKPPGKPTHTFDLKGEYFSFSINIADTRSEGNKTVKKTVEEMVSEYREKLLKALREHRSFLERF